MNRELTHEDHFMSIAQQAEAVKLALGVFLASEALLFTAILALITAYRADWPQAFAEGVRDNTKILGSINTAILLASSALIAIAVELQRRGRRIFSAWLILGTCFLGAVFLAIKFTEYAHHFHEGIYPGGHGFYFLSHRDLGLPTFWTLYFLATGLHAVHISAGILVLGYRGIRSLQGPTQTHSLEAVALYWHLVDVIWIFLWPLFYLA